VVVHIGATGSWLFHCPDLDLLLTGTVDQAMSGGVHLGMIPRLLRAADQA